MNKNVAIKWTNVREKALPANFAEYKRYIVISAEENHQNLSEVDWLIGVSESTAHDIIRRVQASEEWEDYEVVLKESLLCVNSELLYPTPDAELLY